MKNKKMIAVLLSAAMLVISLSGCGSTENTQTGTAESTTDAAESTANTTETEPAEAAEASTQETAQSAPAEEISYDDFVSAA